MKEALSIWWDEKRVGRLTMDEHGDTSFAYDAAWLADPSARPISRSLPKRKEPFDRRRTRPFFAGLLPDETVREVVARILGVSERNDFSLLKALGGDIAGALTILPEDEIPVVYNGAAATTPLTDDELAQLIEVLPKRPFLAGETGVRMSLAGAQTKLPVVLADGKIALPAPGQPTTHILKPSLPLYPATTENEAFIMQLADAIGLVVAPVQPCRVKDKTYLLVTRYDREFDLSGRVRRLHQEDFCQALSITPERKYASEGGPTFKSCFALLREAASRPAIEVLKLLDAVLFNLVVGNADAHGKNFSLLYQADAIVLAPLYDLLCTEAYPELSPKPAMKIAGAATLKDLTASSWQKFSDNIEISQPYLRRRLREICYSAQHNAANTASAIASLGFDPAPLDRYAEIVRDRADLIQARVG